MRSLSPDKNIFYLQLIIVVNYFCLIIFWIRRHFYKYRRNREIKKMVNDIGTMDSMDMWLTLCVFKVL